LTQKGRDQGNACENADVPADMLTAAVPELAELLARATVNT